MDGCPFRQGAADVVEDVVTSSQNLEYPNHPGAVSDYAGVRRLAARLGIEGGPVQHGEPWTRPDHSGVELPEVAVLGVEGD